MKFSARFWLSMRQATCAVLMSAILFGGVLADGALSPARAQFFFPFFDNRPTAPPAVNLRPHRRRADIDLRPRRPRREGVIELRPQRKRHHESRHGAPEKPSAPKPTKPVEAAAPAAPENPPPPYEPQLLRLSEIMGALAYLQSICAAPTPLPVSAQAKAPVKPASEGAASNDLPWRERMENLMTAEGAGPARREKLAGAYNHGLQGYQLSYRVCTPSAQLARRRFLDEGARLAHEISTQYRAN